MHWLELPAHNRIIEVRYSSAPLLLTVTKQPRLLEDNQQFRDWLRSKNVPVKYIETPGDHTMMVFRRNLTELAPLLFQPKK